MKTKDLLIGFIVGTNALSLLTSVLGLSIIEGKSVETSEVIYRIIIGSDMFYSFIVIVLVMIYFKVTEDEKVTA